MLASRYFIGFGIAVARRTAFDDVGNVHGLSRNLNGSQNLIEQLPSTTHKRASSFVLILARTFTNNHQLRVGISFAKDNIFSGRREFASGATRADNAKILEISHDLILPELKLLDATEEHQFRSI
jgi:hypothetical protein